MCNDDMRRCFRQLNLVNMLYCNMLDDFFTKKFLEHYDYTLALAQLLRIQELLENFNANMGIQRTEFESVQVYSEALTLMEQYAQNREKSMAAFRAILHGLKKRADGHLADYNLSQYKQDLSIYQELEDDIVSIGDLLQVQYEKLFPNDQDF